MFVICVEIRVKEGKGEEFAAASRDNASNTLREPGALRFDVLRRLDERERFMLYEVYRDEAAFEAHKLTPHYAVWRDKVADWMAEPRRGLKHEAVFPDAPGQFKSQG